MGVSLFVTLCKSFFLRMWELLCPVSDHSQTSVTVQALTRGSDERLSCQLDVRAPPVSFWGHVEVNVSQHPSLFMSWT